MQIKNTTSQNFKARPLFPIKLKSQLTDSSYKLLDGTFSEILPSCKSDRTTIFRIGKEWKIPAPSNNYSANIAASFYHPTQAKRYFITEVNGHNNDTFPRISSVMETTSPREGDKDCFEIFYLQASPSSFLPPPRKIKGAGALSVYSAVKLAENSGFKRLLLWSTNNSFYERIGLDRVPAPEFEAYPTTGIFQLTRDKFGGFLKKIEDKYSIHS